MKHIVLKLVVLFSVISGISNAQWIPVDMPLQGVITYTNYVSQTDIYVNQSYIHYPNPEQPATTIRIFKSSNNGVSWTLMYSYSGQPLQLVNMTNTSFINSSTGIFGLKYGSTFGIYKTIDAGLNWSFINIPYSGFYVSNCAYLNDSTFIILTNTGGTSYQVLKSTNSGSSWSLNSLPLSDYKNNMYFLNQNIGFIVTSSGYVLKSTDAGSSWNIYYSGMTANLTAISFLNPSTGFMAGNNTTSSLIFKTTNEGVNWNVLSSFGLEYLSSISCRNPSVVYVSGANRLIKSTDEGDNWVQILTFQNVGNSYVTCFNKDTLVVGKLNVIYRSNNGGTLIDSNSTFVPDKFVLSQNYPNPFNPATNIPFELKEPSHVTLKVFDARGREVKELVNGRWGTGKFIADFDASALATGIYFYQIIVSGETTHQTFSETKKMMFLK